MWPLIAPTREGNDNTYGSEGAKTTMAREIAHEAFGDVTPIESDDEAYERGYTGTLREYEWAQARGWTPTQRQLVISLSQAIRVYSAARGGRPISGPRPAWLHGRADALRELIRAHSEDLA